MDFLQSTGGQPGLPSRRKMFINCGRVVGKGWTQACAVSAWAWCPLGWVQRARISGSATISCLSVRETFSALSFPCSANFMVVPYFLVINVTDFIVFKPFFNIDSHKKLEK